MEITIYGARGSHPVAHEKFMRFGGNTTCVLIELENGHHIVFDAGTGIYNLGEDLIKKSRAVPEFKLDIIISHTHWDHIMGFPLFKLFHEANVEGHIHAPVYACDSLEKLFSGQQTELHFPVETQKMNATLKFHEIQPGDEFQISDALVKTVQLNHPGKVIGYRIEDHGKVFSTITDTGPIDNNLLGTGMKAQFDSLPEDIYDQFNKSLRALAKDADMVLHDCHFATDDIKGKEHWGHSTIDQAFDTIVDAHAKRLLIFHHNPFYDDKDVAALGESLKDRSESEGVEVLTAYEGLRVKL